MFSEKSSNILRKMERTQREMIYKWIQRNLAECDDPRRTGKALKGKYAGIWRYRIADYRVFAKIEDETVTILIVDIRHRSIAYA